MKVSKTVMDKIKVEFEKNKFITLTESYEVYRSNKFVSEMIENEDGTISLRGLGFDNIKDNVSTEYEELVRLEIEAVLVEDYALAITYRDKILKLNK